MGVGLFQLFLVCLQKSALKNVFLLDRKQEELATAAVNLFLLNFTVIPWKFQTIRWGSTGHVACHRGRAVIEHQN